VFTVADDDGADDDDADDDDVDDDDAFVFINTIYTQKNKGYISQGR